MSKREPQLLIEDIIESGNKILEFTLDLTFVTGAEFISRMIH
jgi:uncharacterized protein with HEPN domain